MKNVTPTCRVHFKHYTLLAKPQLKGANSVETQSFCHTESHQRPGFIFTSQVPFDGAPASRKGSLPESQLN